MILDRNVINYPKCHSYGPIILRVAKIVKKFVMCNNRLIVLSSEQEHADWFCQHQKKDTRVKNVFQMCLFCTFTMSMFNRGRSQFLLLRHDCGCSRKLKSGGHAGWLSHLFTTLTSSLQSHNSQISILNFLFLNFQFSILAGSTTPKHFFSNKDWILPKVKQPLCVKSIRIIFSATRQKRPDKNVVIVRSRNSIVKRLVSLKEETPLNNKLIYYLVEQIWAYFVILQLIFPLF